MVTKKNKNTKTLNPLLIISLFLSLTELAMLVAATQVSGPLQWVFGIFSVAFGSIVATVFFFLLWKRNQILYSPKDFADRDAIEYVRAMHVSRDSSARYLHNVEREQEIAVLKAETEVQILRQQLDNRNREFQVEMLRIMADRGYLDSSAEMTDFAQILTQSLIGNVKSPENKSKPEIEQGSNEGVDQGQSDSRNGD